MKLRLILTEQLRLSRASLLDRLKDSLILAYKVAPETFHASTLESMIFVPNFPCGSISL